LSHTKKDNDEVEYIEVPYDNITQLIDLVESYRDSINSTRDLYIANVSLQMNDTMKTLTLFSAILLPLTFIASVYGMNGLDLNNINSIPVGFAIVLITMGVVGAFLFWLFKKKQWILVKEDDGNNIGKRQKE
jgi:magnesium transporter